MKRLIFAIFFVFAAFITFRTVSEYYQLDDKNIQAIINDETKNVTAEKNKDQHFATIIAVIVLVVGFIVFFTFNHLAKTEDKGINNALMTFFTSSIKKEFRFSTIDFVDNPFKYFLYQQNKDVNLESLGKISILKGSKIFIDFLMLIFLTGFGEAFKYGKSVLSSSLTNAIYRRAIDEYQEIFQMIYQNLYIKDFFRYNENTLHLIEQLRKEVPESEKQIKDIENNLFIKIRNRRKIKRLYLLIGCLFVLSAFLCAWKKDGLFQYLNVFFRFKYTLLVIFAAFAKHYKIYQIKKELISKSAAVDNFNQMNEVLNYVSNRQACYIIWMLAMRICFSQSKSFSGFLFELIIEGFTDFMVNKASSQLFKLTNLVSNFKENPFIDNLLSNFF